MIIDGVNLGPNWTNDRGETGPYNELLTFGPFAIADGPQSYQFVDVSDDDCVIYSTVQPPMPCSNDCDLIPTVTNLSCDDNGTPYDPADDTYTFDLSVEGINTPSVAYSVDGGGAFLYDQTNTFGPFPIDGDDYSFTLNDLGGGSCSLSFTLEEIPQSCSDACGISIDDARVVCDDGGTEEAGDDALYVEVLVSSLNPGARGWRTEGVEEGLFGEYVRIGTATPGGQTITVSVEDLDVPGCTASFNLTTPAISISCPDDAFSVPYSVSIQTLRDSLTQATGFTAGDQEVCWLAEETYGSARRYRQRYTLIRSDSVPGLQLYSFYLYAPAETELLGAVFSLMGEETLDCCNLATDGPVTAQPTNDRSLPVLPPSVAPDSYGLKQQFSVALRPAEEYTLVVSSPTPGVVGDFSWVIVSANGEPLEVGRPSGPPPVVTAGTTAASFDLLLHETAQVVGVTASQEVFGAPELDSVCSPANIAFSDSLLSTCDRALLSRSFDVTVGDSTFAAACSQEITFRALGLTDITWPEHQIRFGCTDDYPLLDNGHPDPAYTGYPFVYYGGRPRMLDSSRLENLTVGYADELALLADGGREIVRTWTVSDLCRLTATTYEQTFKLDSDGVPFFTCPINNHYCPIVEEDIMLWAVGLYDCTADVLIPEPELNNVCDTSSWTFLTEIYVLTAEGDTVLMTTLDLNSSRLLEDLPPADYLMRFVGIHASETIAPRYCRFRVADLTEPVAVCKSLINLSVPGNGRIRIGIPQIDQGSYDNCGLVLEELRRRLPEGHPEADSLGWSAWGEFLYFDCDDVGLDWTVQYRIQDGAGNHNFCTSTVTIRDNTDPYCTGLEEQFVSCAQLPDGFSAFDTMALRLAFGMPTVVDNCAAWAIELPPVVAGDDCRPDHIRRRFRAVDQHGNESPGIFYQDINVTPALTYAIGFPADLDTDCSDLTDTLAIIGTACDSITVSYTDISLPVEGEECRYFQRSFTVTNWCEWDGISPAIQVGRDEDCDNTNGEETAWLVRTEEGIFVDGDSLTNNNFPAANSRGVLCGGENPEGYFREITDLPGGRYVYHQRIRIFDVTPPAVSLSMIDSICVDTSFCRAPVTVGITVSDACQVAEGQIVVGVDFNADGIVESTSASAGTLTGSYPDYVYTMTMPIGDHRFVFTVTDDCGNTSETVRDFRVNDCFVPTLICRGDRIYDLVPVLEPGDIDGDGLVEEAAVLVEAVDLARCNTADCSGELTFSVNRVGEPADRNQHSMFLDCEDRYSVDLELYVWDEAFNPFSVQPDGTLGGNNWRRCTVRVYVQDPEEVCNGCAVGDDLTINGAVLTPGGAPLTGVTILAGEANGTTVTDAAGSYELGGRVGGSYVLSASSEADPRAGLSTIDVLILQYHLLGIRVITDPHLLLAADLDRDGALTSSDLILLQALVLGREEFYPSGSTWRFVAAGWDGSGIPPETITLADLQDCSFGHDFVGLKLGDLNDTLGAAAGAGRGTESGVSRDRPVALSATDRTVTAGEQVTINLNLEGHDKLAGGQLGLRWDRSALSLLGYQGEGVSADNLLVRGNRLRLSWRDPAPQSNVLTLTFRATSTGKLSNLLLLEDAAGFRDEVYTPELLPKPLYLRWTEADATEPEVNLTSAHETALLGVFPNPVRTTARIGIVAQRAQTGQLRITAADGRTVVDRRVELGSGEQYLSVDVYTWPAGTYHFSVVLDDKRVAGTLICGGSLTK